MALLANHQPGTKPPPGLRLSYEEFLETEFNHGHYEWVDGEVIEMPPVENENNGLETWLVLLLGMYLQLTERGDLRIEPFQMRLAGQRSGRAPDIQVILMANLPRLERMYLDGPADVVIEITSAGSRRTDRIAKFQEYQAGGVPEYWIIDPLRKQAEFYILDNARFRPGPLDDEGRYLSPTLPGVVLDVAWLWDRPPVREVLKTWGML